MWQFLKSLLPIRVVINRASRSIPAAIPASNGATISTPGGSQISFMLNDPAVPDLLQQIDVPTFPAICPSFQVENYVGPGHPFDSSEGNSAQVYATLAATMTMFQKVAATPVSRWVAVDTLIVQPRTALGFNAYYDRLGLHFFYGRDPIRNKVIFASESVDVVAHELGHALLDCLRPDLWNTQSLEVWAFHESWGDMIAMLTSMQFDAVLDRILNQTSNSLYPSNTVSRLAEDMSLAIYNNIKANNGDVSDFDPTALRDAVNAFEYTPPEGLPPDAPRNALCAEPHNFSRVFTGAFYDMLAGIYQKELSKGKGSQAALQSARDVSATLIVLAATTAPAVPRFFESVAKSILLIDQRIGSQYQTEIKNAFEKRKILVEGVTALASTKLSDVDTSDRNVRMLSTDVDTTVHKLGTKLIRLADYDQNISHKLHTLYHAQIEIPTQSFMHFNFDGNLIDEIKAMEQQSISSAKACLNYLDSKEQVGHNTEGNFDFHFSITNGKLVRNFMRCNCHKG